jgi:hypothetical protein
MGIQKTKIELGPEIVRQIATKFAIGSSLRDLEKDYGVSRPIITRAVGSELGQSVIKEFIQNGVEKAKQEAQKICSELVELAGIALKKKVEEGDLKAVEMVFKVVGAGYNQEKDQTKQQQAIQVILPGSVIPKEVSNA